MFFVISGFLITTLLLRDQERMGHLRLRRFYFRRAMRILPPFDVFLAGVTLVTAAGGFPRVGRAWPARLYLSNFVPTLKLMDSAHVR